MFKVVLSENLEFHRETGMGAIILCASDESEVKKLVEFALEYYLDIIVERDKDGDR